VQCHIVPLLGQGDADLPANAMSCSRDQNYHFTLPMCHVVSRIYETVLGVRSLWLGVLLALLARIVQSNNARAQIYLLLSVCREI
jgi:hypothetical protein